jgi:tRNA 2-thiouridine synthesizing protein A
VTEERGPLAVLLDASHEGCGALLVLIFQAMRALALGEVLEVRGYDPGAPVDILAWCRMAGNTLLDAQGDRRPAAPLRYLIQKKEHEPGKAHGQHHAREGQR